MSNVIGGLGGLGADGGIPTSMLDSERNLFKPFDVPDDTIAWMCRERVWLEGKLSADWTKVILPLRRPTSKQVEDLESGGEVFPSPGAVWGCLVGCFR